MSRKSSNLIFRIDEQLHFEYQRKENDLFTTVYLPLADALDSKSIQVTTLDNRILRVPMD